MELKYIYNEQGEKESVIVPIKEWEEKDARQIQGYNKGERVIALNKLKESFKNVNSQEVINEIVKMRTEWERNF